MSKTKLTKKIEKAIYKKLHGKTRYRFAFEVPIESGYADCVAYKLDFKNDYKPYVVCAEIKISYSDFKSENGHNLYGDENYYIVSEELFKELKKRDLLEGLKSNDVGIFVYYEKSNMLKMTIESNADKIKKINWEDRDYYKLIDDICRLWQNGKVRIVK